MKPKQPRTYTLSLILSRAEKIMIAFLIAGCVFLYMDIDSANTVLMVATAMLAIILFANAFVPFEIYDSEEDARAHEPLGMMDLLGLTIIPKVLWIGSAVSMFGIFAYLADFGNKGYLKMSLIGGFTILISLVVLAIAQISGVKKLSVVIHVVYRAVAPLLVDYYLVYVA
jgi:hypothetical protein